LNALFNHAQENLQFEGNPCKKVNKMGKSDADKSGILDEMKNMTDSSPGLNQEVRII